MGRKGAAAVGVAAEDLLILVRRRCRCRSRLTVTSPRSGIPGPALMAAGEVLGEEAWR